MNEPSATSTTPASGARDTTRTVVKIYWLAAKIAKRHEFFVPALSVGAHPPPRVQVSRKFWWCRLFDVQNAALKTLQQGSDGHLDPARALASNTGRQNSHHHISQGLKD